MERGFNRLANAKRRFSQILIASLLFDFHEFLYLNFQNLLEILIIDKKPTTENRQQFRSYSRYLPAFWWVHSNLSSKKLFF